MVQTGVYGSNDPAGVKAYAGWVGAMPNNVLAYLNNDSWSGFDSSIGYEVSLWKHTKASNIWSVPLTVWGTSLEQVATGSYNDHFLKAAQSLAQTKPSADGNIYIRAGWEFNGSWMPWAAEGHEGAFIKSFQNLVDTFRSVSDKFKFVWDVNEGDSTYNPTKAYPGDKYVDVVGMDTYYNTAWDSTDPIKAFQHNVKAPYGLQWQQDFAAAHGKATAISEWGVMSDNAGPYIQALTKWMSDHNMVFENYWDSNADYSGLLSNGQNPNAGAAYKAAMAALQAGSPAPAPVSDHTLVLKVSGDSYKGTPHFIVTVDGEQVGGTLTTSAAHASGQTQDITLTGRFDSGAHDIAIQFLDDAWGGAGNDRNLYVHQISLDGQVYAGSASTNTAGSNGNGMANMLSNGTATFQAAASTPAAPVVTKPPASSAPASLTTPTVPSASDTLVLKVSGDSYQGTPHFVVTVDGQQVGGTLTTSAAYASGQTQDITLTGNFGSGAHDVAVKFLDDVYGGSSAADRNLYVHQISLNGQVQAGSTSDNTAGPNSNGVANLWNSGSATFHTSATASASGETTPLLTATPTTTASDTLVLKVSGDSYQGTPHFLVTVDGQQVGGTLTTSAAHASGQTQDITLTGNFGAGAHDVAVKFLDDVYGGSSAADRNLYVHQISLNGQVQAGSTSDNTAGPNSNGVANLWNSGSATFHTSATASASGETTPLLTATPTTTASDTLVLKVSGDSYQGTPHFLVTVDGQQVGGTLTTSAAHASGQTQDITLTGNFGAGAHDVAVKFLDDVYGGSSAADRNLYVHQISLNGQVQAGSTSDNTAGSSTNGVANMLSNGTATFHTGGSDTLVFKVSGDSYQGTPHFLVTVDGQQVGGTLTTSAAHASGQTQDITLTGNFGAGAHDVAVKFIDDVYGGSAATDRNLYVHQVSLNGHIQAGDLADNHAGANLAGVANLLSSGSVEWHI